MLPVTSVIQSDILHLYLRAVDVYIKVSQLPYMQSIPVLANCHGLSLSFYGILKLEVTYNIISILLLYMDEIVYTSSLISKKCCF